MPNHSEDNSSRPGRLAAALVVGLLLGGCGPEAPPLPKPELSAEEAWSARKLGLEPASRGGVSRALQSRELAPARLEVRRSLAVDKPQVLALSGGGQWGAFGAGFLKGWTRKGDRPESFNVVTGTSTGSLIATFAFLGKGYDDAVGNAYLGIRGDRDVMDKRFLLFALFQESLATTEPLRRLIEGVITDDVVKAVAAEGAQGRKLYVGAADLDLGIFKPFDLTAIAAGGGPAARRAYVDALMASSAIPVAFPPVTIDGHTYVDGGVRRNVFLELLVDELRRMREERGLATTDPTVYCLVNGTLNVGSAQVKRRVLDIARRSTDVLLDESTDGNLLRIYLQAQRSGLRFRMTRVPPGMCSVLGSGQDQFDPAVMRCLHTGAQAFAQSDDAWTSEPPLAEGVP